MAFNEMDEEVREEMKKALMLGTKIHRERSPRFTISDFKLVRLLGKGHFSQVWLAHHNFTLFPFAIKICDKKHLKEENGEGSKCTMQLFLEIFLHSKVSDHPYIITYHAYFYDEEFFYILLEYASNRTLFSYLQKQQYKRFSETKASMYIYQLASALSECNAKGFFHGDLKPENVLLGEDGNVRLSDFGLSCPYLFEDIRGFCGTIEYLPPEVLNLIKYDKSIDNWSLGVLCYELLVGKNPFSDKTISLTSRRIHSLNYEFPPYVKEDARDLITSLLQKNPSMRLSFDAVMSHNWILRCRPDWPSTQLIM